MEKTLGIDLGTESARLAHLVDGEPVLIVNENRQSDIPAYIGFGKKGDILVGEAARNRYQLHPECVAHSFLQLVGRSVDDPVFKAFSNHLATPIYVDVKGNPQVLIGEKDFTPLDLLALFLYTLKNNAEKSIGMDFSRAVLSLPDHFGERQITAVRLAAAKAGLTPLQIVHQTSAAALEHAYSIPDTGERLVLVYSLGRVFDTAVVKICPGTIEVLGSEGDSLFGGDFFTDRLTTYLLERIEQKTERSFTQNNEAVKQIRRVCEGVKVNLSSLLSVDIEINSLGKQQINYEDEISREAFEQIIRPGLIESFNIAGKAMWQAGIAPEQLHAILMVGSSCQIPIVERLLREHFPAAQINRPVNQKNAVVLGAAVYTGLISNITCEKCQHNNKLVETVCVACGTALDNPAKMLCPSCLSVENSGQDMCAKCGYAFSTPSAAPVDKAEPAPAPMPIPVGMPVKEVEQAQCTIQFIVPAKYCAFELEISPQERKLLPIKPEERLLLTELEWRNGIWRGLIYGMLPGGGQQHVGTLVIRLGEARASAERLEVEIEHNAGTDLLFIIRPVRSAQVQFWHGRRGRWELGVYQRQHGLVTAQPEKPVFQCELNCCEPNCVEEGHLRCSWCGRFFCGQHLITSESRLQICATCLEPVLRQFAAVAGHTGNLDALETMLNSLRPGQKNHPILNLYFGLVKAQRGVFQDAVPILDATAPATGLDLRLLGQAHLGRAKQRLETHDMPGVMQDLVTALRDDPSIQQGNHHLDLLELQIFQMVESGDLAKAIFELEKQREATPLDVKTIHRLAILYYRLITQYEEAAIRSAKGETTLQPDLPVESIAHCWHRLIAYWGAVLFSSAYWQEWLAQRCAVSGLSVDQNVVDTVRKAFEERVLQDARDWVMEYRDAGLSKQAERLSGADLLWEFELETARLLSEVSTEFQVAGWPARFTCGTVMMNFLQTSPAGKPAVDGLLAALPRLSGESSRKLQRYLTRIGRYHFLLDHHYYERVLVELEPMAHSAEAKAVLGRGYCQRGSERLSMDDVEKGVADFEQGRKNGADLSEYSVQIAEAVVKFTLQRLADLGDPAYDGMIDLLERTRSIIGNEPSICSNLVASLGQRARIANNADKYAEAEKYLERALAIDPNDKTIRHFTAVTYSNIAIELLKKDQKDPGLDYLKRSLSFENSNNIRDIIYNVLAEKALAFALGHNRNSAIAAMQEALQYDSNVHGAIPPLLPYQRITVVLINRGVEVANNDRFTEALNIFNEAKTYYDDPDIPTLLAVTYSRMGKKIESINCWRVAYQRKPGDSKTMHSLCTALHNYGVDLANGGYHNDAINYLLEALRLENDPTTRKILAQVYVERGIKRYNNGDPYGGRQDVQQSLSLEPYNSDYKNILYKMR